MDWTGGCLCGAVRYESDEPPRDVHYCHCRMCQRTNGAPVVVGVPFGDATFRFTRGAPKLFNSSDFAARGFCADCGSRLTYQARDDSGISVEIGSLDYPDQAPPVYHTGVESWISWLAIEDDLPCRKVGDAEFGAPRGYSPTHRRETAATDTIEGGCFCGALRYRSAGGPLRGSICHCGTCRKVGGSPVLAWSILDTAGFEWIAGAPKEYWSSETAARGFCDECGTPLTFRFDEQVSDAVIGVTTASIDRPAAFPPTRHLWVSSRLPWVDMPDGLPRNAGHVGDEIHG